MLRITKNSKRDNCVWLLSDGERDKKKWIKTWRF